MQRRLRSCRGSAAQTSKDGVNGDAFRRGTAGHSALLRRIGRPSSPSPRGIARSEAPASPLDRGFFCPGIGTVSCDRETAIFQGKGGLCHRSQRFAVGTGDQILPGQRVRQAMRGALNPRQQPTTYPAKLPVVTFFCFYLCHIMRNVYNWIVVGFTIDPYNCADGKRPICILAYLIAIEFGYGFNPGLRFHHCLRQNRWHRADRESD